MSRINQTNALTTNILAQIQRAERQLMEAQLTSDADVLDTLLADDLIFVGPDGRLYNKADDLTGHRSGAMRLTHSSPHEPFIKLLPGVAIVSVVVDLRGFIAEQPIDGSYRYTRVWTSQNGSWRAIAGHCTLVQDGGIPG